MFTRHVCHQYLHHVTSRSWSSPLPVCPSESFQSSMWEEIKHYMTQNNNLLRPTERQYFHLTLRWLRGLDKQGGGAQGSQWQLAWVAMVATHSCASCHLHNFTWPFPESSESQSQYQTVICKAYLSERSLVSSVPLGRTQLQNYGVTRVPFIFYTRAEKGAVAAGKGLAWGGAHWL